jgi:hypothetical protein
VTSAKDKERQELLTLLGAVRDGSITSDQQHRINALLERSPKLIQYYVEFALLNTELQGYRFLSYKAEQIFSNDLLTEQLIDGSSTADAPSPDLSESKGQSPQDQARVAEIRFEAQRRLNRFLAENEPLPAQPSTAPRRIRRSVTVGELAVHAARFMDKTFAATAKATVRLAVAAVIILVTLVARQHFLSHRIVATLDEAIHAQWNQAPLDANLYPGEVVLKQGFAKLTFKQGAQVIVQAPCVFNLRSPNRMILQSGTVTALVPPEAYGFVIKTPNSTVTDFGTEFGVQVKAATDAEVHVFDGHVKFKPDAKGNKPSKEYDLTEGGVAIAQASGGITISETGSRPRLFMRQLPDANQQFSIPNKRLDLADVVGGGSGFGTGSRLTCIDPTTGRVHSVYRHAKRTETGVYVPVPELAYVDGVFVPPNQGGLVEVSTDQDRCQFPPARGGWYTELAHGGAPDLRTDPPKALILDRQAYGSGNHPALLMHANIGITFDLDVFRKDLGSTRVTAFTSKCGVSQHVQNVDDPKAIFYVLVDGHIQFNQEIGKHAHPAARVRVELRQNDRFLTLACLAGQENAGDWSFFGEPALELDATASTPTSF